MNLFNNDGADKMVKRKETCMIDCTPGTCFCESAKAEQAPCGDVSACKDEGCPYYGIAIKCDPYSGGCLATLQTMRPAESAPIRASGQEDAKPKFYASGSVAHGVRMEFDKNNKPHLVEYGKPKPEHPNTLVERLHAELENAYKAGADCEIEIRALKKELNTIKFTIRPEAVTPDREAGNEFFRKTFFWNTQPFTSTVQRQSMLESISPSAGDAVYGYCPVCGAKGVKREKRPFGNDICDNGHEYPSATAVQLAPEPKAKDDDFERRINALFTKWAGCYGSAPAKMLRELRSIARVTPL